MYLPVFCDAVAFVFVWFCNVSLTLMELVMIYVKPIELVSSRFLTHCPIKKIIVLQISRSYIHILVRESITLYHCSAFSLVFSRLVCFSQVKGTRSVFTPRIVMLMWVLQTNSRPLWSEPKLGLLQVWSCLACFGQTSPASISGCIEVADMFLYLKGSSCQ